MRAESVETAKRLVMEHANSHDMSGYYLDFVRHHAKDLAPANATVEAAFTDAQKRDVCKLLDIYKNRPVPGQGSYHLWADNLLIKALAGMLT